jgi:hypothetical protein
MNPLIFIAQISLPLIMLFVGIWLGTRMRTPPNAEQIQKFMNRVVNQEEMAEHERVTKYKMARNGLKSQRYDSGPNARVMRMKIRPRPRRPKNGSDQK